MIVKGAPEDLLRLSGRYEDANGKVLPLDPETRHAFEATLDELGAQGLRALGVASRVVDESHATAAISDESDLVFSGFAVFLDPPSRQFRTKSEGLISLHRIYIFPPARGKRHARG